VPDLWYQVRKKIADMKSTLPQGVQGPAFNDEFGDTFGTVYAFTSDGFSYRELKDYAESARAELMRVPNVGKVQFVGIQNEKIYLDFSTRQLAAMGIDRDLVIQELQAQNAVAPAGVVQAGDEKITVRVSGAFTSEDSLRAISLRANGKFYRLADVAQVRRGYADPPTPLFRYNGEPAIGLIISMAAGGNMLTFGEGIREKMHQVEANLPDGINVHLVANQSVVVEESIAGFTKALKEAVIIVLAVSFVSLGLRAGMVVATSIPLVLAMTFMGMEFFGIELQRISLGALIIALGLLVDDAMITVEMMITKLEEGFSLDKAATFAYTSTAFPMLTGTIVTAAGFVPVGLAQSAAGEYTNAIFWVVGLSLLLSWVVAVIFTPYLGFILLPKPKHVHHHGEELDIYNTRGYRILRRAVEVCVRARWVTIGVTVAAFFASLVGFGFVQQQFFPSASRPELLVDIRLAEGSSFEATAAEVRRMEEILSNDPNVDYWAAYTGGGSPRFYLPLDQQLQNSNFAQFMVMTKGLEEREHVLNALESRAETDFPAARVRVSRLENGPPVGYPVQFRVTGTDPATIRKIAYDLRDRMRAHPNMANVHLDWDELSKRVRLQVDTAKARALGISKQELSNALQLLLNGMPVTQYREGTELIGVVLRTTPDERLDLSRLGELNIRTGRGDAVPLSQVASVRYELEEPILWRRGRETTMTVKGDVVGGVQAPVVSAELNAQFDAVRAALPDGYAIAMGGAIEESAKGQDSINAMLPLMLLIMVATLMIQLQSFSRVAMVLLTAPLGLIGVTASLLIFNLPFGFVAMLGVIALAGIIMRNSVILVDQIEQDVRQGRSRWDGIVEATVRRARPIALTAAAAILAMIPLAKSAFWGPMAVAIMGGLTGATVLTIFFLPALYAAWFRVKAPERRAQGSGMPQGAMHLAE